MKKMGFSSTCINWIMRCISSVKYKVLMYGQPRENNVFERRLRQRNHLSPFIFILCTNSPISLLSHAKNQGKITGMRVSRASPLVSYLLFFMIAFFFIRRSPVNVKKL